MTQLFLCTPAYQFPLSLSASPNKLWTRDKGFQREVNSYKF